MEIFAFTLEAIADILHVALRIYTFVVIAAVLITWVNPDPYNPIVRILRQLTEPVLARIRRTMPRALWRTGLDFSPLVLLLLITLIDRILVRYILTLAARI